MFQRVLYYFKHHVWRVFNLLKFKTFLMGKMQCKQSTRRESCRPNFFICKQGGLKQSISFLRVILPRRHLGRLWRKNVLLLQPTIMWALRHYLGELETSRPIQSICLGRGSVRRGWVTARDLNIWQSDRLKPSGCRSVSKVLTSASSASFPLSRGLESEKESPSSSEPLRSIFHFT